MTIDTSNLSQDEYFFYFTIPDDTSVTFKDYKYQYKYKKMNKKSVDRVFVFNGCKARVKANRDSIVFIPIVNCGPQHFKFILWLDSVIYIIYVDTWKVTKICKVDERINGAGCIKTP